MHETRSSQTGMNCGKQGRGLKVDIHALRFPVGCVCDLCMKAHQQAVRFTVRIKVRKAGAMKQIKLFGGGRSPVKRELPKHRKMWDTVQVGKLNSREREKERERETERKGEGEREGEGEFWVKKMTPNSSLPRAGFQRINQKYRSGTQGPYVYRSASVLFLYFAHHTPHVRETLWDLPVPVCLTSPQRDAL